MSRKTVEQLTAEKVELLKEKERQQLEHEIVALRESLGLLSLRRKVLIALGLKAQPNTVTDSVQWQDDFEGCSTSGSECHAHPSSDRECVSDAMESVLFSTRREKLFFGGAFLDLGTIYRAGGRSLSHPGRRNSALI